MKQAIEIISYALLGIAGSALLIGIVADLLKHHKSCNPIDREEISIRASSIPLADWEIVCYVEDLGSGIKEVIVETVIDDVYVIATGRTLRGKLVTVFDIDVN